MSPLELLLCALLIFCSAYISASETALFSLTRFQLRFLKENFRPVHRKIKRLLSDPGGLLITLLVVNEVFNIALSALITKTVSKSHYSVPHSLSSLPNWAFNAALGILISTPIILFVCEITPKVVGARANKLVATLAAGPLTLIYAVFKPVRFILKHIIMMISNTTTRSDEPILKESEFLLMVEEGHKEGAIQENELELIRNVFELDNTSVSEVATPLSQVLSLPATTPIRDAFSAIRSQRYSRIPIVGANKKEVVGILYSKDLLRTKLNHEVEIAPVATLMRKPHFVSSTMKLNHLFRTFKQNKTHMAIVKNSLDEVVGVVTMSDVLDALFEDLFADADELPHNSPLNSPMAQRKA